MNRKSTTPIAVSIATVMLLLDVTVVKVALSGIQTDLGACFDELRWAIDAYALTLAATMLIFGSISDRLRRRRVLTIGLAAVSLARSPAASAGTRSLSTSPAAFRRSAGR